MWRSQSGGGGGKYWLWVNIKSEIACDQIFLTPLPQDHPSFFILGTHARSLINTLQTTCHPFFLLSFGMLRNMPQYIRVVMQKHHLMDTVHCIIETGHRSQIKMKIFFKAEWKGTAQFVASLSTSWYLFMNGFGWQTCQRHNQGTFNWRASSYPDFIQNYFLLKHMLDYFDNRDKCRNPGFLREAIFTLLAFLRFL